MSNNYDLAVNFVQENFSHSSIEIIFVPFSTAGGSGAGIAPILLSLLTESLPSKVFVPMPIIPDKKEAYTSQRNCLETFEDLSQLDLLLLPIDNEKAKRQLNSNNKSLLYKKTNSFVVDKIEKLLTFTELNSKNGIVDKRDLKAVFSTVGVGTIGEVDLTKGSLNKDMSEKGIANCVKSSWISSLFADVEMKKLTSAAFIYNGQDRIMDMINMGSIFDGFQNKMPVNLYEGYYENEGGTIITVLTGLNWCNTRLKEIDGILQQASSLLNSIPRSEKYKATTLEQDVPIFEAVTKKEKVKDISSLINRFKR
jgi:cell division GTPase FtsZ